MFPSLPGEEKSLYTHHHRSEGRGGDILREFPAVPGGHHLLSLRLLCDGNCDILRLSGICEFSFRISKNLFFHNTKYFKLHPWIKILQKDSPNDDQIKDKENYKGKEKPKAKIESETGIN